MDPGNANIELWFRCCFLASVSEKLSKSSTSPKQQGKNSDPNLNSEKKIYLRKIKNGPNAQGTGPLEKVFPSLMLPLLSSTSISQLSISFLI